MQLVKFSILKIFNSYLYNLSPGFIASTRAFNLLIRAFNLPTRAFNHATHAFSLLTRGFAFVTRGFELVTRNSCFTFPQNKFVNNVKTIIIKTLIKTRKLVIYDVKIYRQN